MDALSPDHASPASRHARSQSANVPAGLQHRNRHGSNQSLDRPSFSRRNSPQPTGYTPVTSPLNNLHDKIASPTAHPTTANAREGSHVSTPSATLSAIAESRRQPWVPGAHKLSSINWIGSSPVFSKALPDHLEDQFTSAIPNGTFNSSSLLPLNNGPLALLDINDAFHTGSPTSANQGKKRIGYYYVDGGGSRLPRVKKRRLTVDAFEYPPVDIANPSMFYFCIPQISEPPPSKARVEYATYDAITQAYMDHCIRNTLLQPNFEEAPFITQAALNYLIELYITHMHPLLPILHLPSLDLNQCHWALALAMATFGASFLKDPQSRTLNIALQELLRRVLLILSANLDKVSQSKYEELWLAQAGLLSGMSGFYSGNARLHRSAYNMRSSLCAFCLESWALPAYIDEDRPDGHDENIWLTWAFNESVRRTGFAIWLLDSMLAYQIDYPPLLALEHAKVPLPCPEIMFDARNQKEWITLSKLATPMPSLIVATELLYAKKHINIITGEYSRVLLIHAIFQRTWDVQRYVNQPLSHLVPVSEPDKACSPASNSSMLPSLSLVSGWLNAACSALNVLHWGANACVAAQSGVEHPTILHLHLAHIVLLAPIQALSNLANHLAGTAPFRSQKEQGEARDQILEWVQNDQDKARLAVIRAGGIFWHVRRYSSSGFYEPAAVFHASLVLWAYATFSHLTHPMARSNSQPQYHLAVTSPESEYDSDAGKTEVINLDRPLDDELAATFVRDGATMRAFLTGVGDLTERESPLRVAQRGQKLLRTLTAWGYAWRYIQVLDMLGREPYRP